MFAYKFLFYLCKSLKVLYIIMIIVHWCIYFWNCVVSHISYLESSIHKTGSDFRPLSIKTSKPNQLINHRCSNIIFLFMVRLNFPPTPLKDYGLQLHRFPWWPSPSPHEGHHGRGPMVRSTTSRLVRFVYHVILVFS